MQGVILICQAVLDALENVWTSKKALKQGFFKDLACESFGADEQIRTAYLLITNEVLYRLSYIST